jgi:hypothetical protein
MAETTALNLVVRALQEIGIYGASEPVASQDADLALDVLNDMMDVWSNEPQACYTTLEQSAVLVPGQATYLIGIGAPDFNMTRPLNIIEGPGSAYTTDANGNTYNMEVVQRDKWNMYSNRSSLINSNFPSVMFYEPTFPYGTIHILPYPNIAYTMYWDSYLQLQEFPTLTTAISLPPGYNAAIRHNLAVELWPFFGSGELNKTIIFMASRSLGSVKRTNGRPAVAIYDPEIVSRAKVSYNPYSDSPGNVVR